MCPSLSFPLCVHSSVLYICSSIPALQIGPSLPSFRFHVHVLIDSICFSLSDWLRSIWQTLGSAASLQMTQFCTCYGWVIFRCISVMNRLQVCEALLSANSSSPLHSDDRARRGWCGLVTESLWLPWLCPLTCPGDRGGDRARSQQV